MDRSHLLGEVKCGNFLLPLFNDTPRAAEKIDSFGEFQKCDFD
jgi:hypothetical protein